MMIPGKSKLISLFVLVYPSIANSFVRFSSCNIQLLYWVCREASQLAALLKEMKEGLDNVRRKIQSLTAKV